MISREQLDALFSAWLTQNARFNPHTDEFSIEFTDKSTISEHSYVQYDSCGEMEVVNVCTSDVLSALCYWMDTDIYTVKKFEFDGKHLHIYKVLIDQGENLAPTHIAAAVQSTIKMVAIFLAILLLGLGGLFAQNTHTDQRFTEDIAFSFLVNPKTFPHSIRIGIVNDLSTACSDIAGYTRVEYKGYTRQLLEATRAVGFEWRGDAIVSLQYLLVDNFSQLARTERARGGNWQERIDYHTSALRVLEANWGGTDTVWQLHRAEVLYQELNPWLFGPDLYESVDAKKATQEMVERITTATSVSDGIQPIQAHYIIAITDTPFAALDKWADPAVIIVLNPLMDTAPRCSGTFHAKTFSEAIKIILEEEANY